MNSFPPYPEHRPLLGYRPRENRCWQRCTKTPGIVCCMVSFIIVGVALVVFAVVAQTIREQDADKSEDKHFKHIVHDEEAAEAITAFVGGLMALGGSLLLWRFCKEDELEDSA